MKRPPVFACQLILIACTAIAGAQHFKRDIPDYDQKRKALPGGGDMYCVPTAYSDCLRYMGLNGLGSADGATNSSYSSITNLIKILGEKMGTDATTGTNGSDAFDAIVDWFDDRVATPTLHVGYAVDGNWGIGTMHNWLTMGAICRIGYGRYTKDSHNVLTRNGGHAIALAGYDWSKPQKQFFVSDPNTDDGNTSTQGAFVWDEKEMWNIPMTYNGDPIQHARYTNWTGTGNQLAIVDDMHVMLPLCAGYLFTVHTPAKTHPAGGGFLCDITDAFQREVTFHAVVPHPLQGADTPRTFDVDVPGPVREWCFDPGDTAIYVLDDNGDIYHANFVTQERTKVGNVPNARKLAVAGTRFSLYVLHEQGPGDELVKFDFVTNRRSGIRLQRGITSIHPDPTTLGIAALHESSKRLFRIDPELRQARPEPIDIPEGAGETFVALNRTGTISIAKSRSAAITRTGVGRLQMEQAPAFEALEGFGRDRLLYQEGSKIHAIDASGRAIKGPFDDLNVEGTFHVAQTWKAFRKSDVSGPAWRNVLPKPGEP